MGKTRVSVENLRFDPSTSLKTINGQSIYGSGDLCIQAGASGVPLGAKYNDALNNSYAYGEGTVTNSCCSLAMGYNSIAYSYSNVAIGYGVSACGYQSVSMGYMTKSGNLVSTSVGYCTESIGCFTTALGTNAKACSNYGVAVGTSVSAGNCSVVMGYDQNMNINTCNSVLVGYSNKVTDYSSGSVFFGQSNCVHYTACCITGNTLFGRNNITYSNSNTLFGVGNIACGYGNVSIGEYNVASYSNSTIFGKSNSADTSSVIFGENNVSSTVGIGLGICNDVGWGSTSVGRWNVLNSFVGLNFGFSNRVIDDKCMMVLGAGLDVINTDNPYKIMIGFDKSVDFSSFRNGTPTTTTIPAIGVLEDDTTVLKGLKIAAGASAGKVLTSDANGVATWQDPGSAGSAGAAVYIQKTEPVVAVGKSALWIVPLPNGSFTMNIIQN